jgi:heme/copper-type cytochrome/quinol oxidase subunit 2
MLVYTVFSLCSLLAAFLLRGAGDGHELQTGARWGCESERWLTQTNCAFIFVVIITVIVIAIFFVVRIVRSPQSLVLGWWLPIMYMLPFDDRGVAG